MGQPAQRQGTPAVQGAVTRRPDRGQDGYRGPGGLTGTAAVITGGAGWIGRAVPIACARIPVTGGRPNR